MLALDETAVSSGIGGDSGDRETLRRSWSPSLRRGAR